MSEFSELKAAYTALTGKNPPPMSADKLRAKIAELQGQSQPTAEQPSQGPSETPEQPGASEPPAEQAAATAPAEHVEQTEADELGVLGLTLDDDGLVTLELLTGLSGPNVCLSAKDAYRCGPTEAVRFVRGDLAKPGQVRA
jgi:hypothetical protein